MTDGKARREELERLEETQEALRSSIEQSKRLAEEAEHLVQRARRQDPDPLPAS